MTNESMRLQKYLSRCGVASRRQAEKLIAEGRIKVNGLMVSETGTKVDPHSDRVEFNGRMVSIKSHEVIALHKPRNIVCTADDPEGRPTVYEFLPPEMAHLRYVGRLDFDSSGLLLFSNDGDLIYRLTRPEFRVEKRYVARVEGTPNAASLAKLKNGVESDGELLQARTARVLSSQEGWSDVEVVLTEGKNREIRRMLELAGYPVFRLKRVAFANIVLDDRIPPGKWRTLTALETDALKNAGSRRRRIRRD